MSFKLSVFNPSDYWRKSHVTLPWQPVYEETGISPEELVLRDSSNTPLPVQVDHIDPDDQSRDTLVFSLAQPIPPGPEDYSKATAFVNVERDDPMAPKNGGPRLMVVPGEGGHVRGVKLINRRLKLWFNLIPAPWDDERTWFAGSASTVEFDGKEILDPFRAELDCRGHDPEKRCMQVDQLQLCYPPWETMPHQQVNLFNRSYQLVSQSNGPVRASITIASEPFEYRYSDPVMHKKSLLQCQLYRVISLYADCPDCLTEELFVKGKLQSSPGEVVTDTEVINLRFTARYFAYMDMGFFPSVYRFAPLPDWFAVGSPSPPYPGYGFATDTHIATVVHPHPNLPDWSNAYKSFSWQLYPCKSAKCLHLFMRDQLFRLEDFLCGLPKDFDSRTGRYWYESIFKPLNAKIYGGT